ncbi:hypothetical protein BH18VER1_BH18VER1_01860 [soil metagenome]
MPDGDRKPESNETDPKRLAQLLELELIQKRSSWQQARERRGNLRTVSLLFFFLVAAGTLAAFFFLFSSGRMTDIRTRATHNLSPTPGASP